MLLKVPHILAIVVTFLSILFLIYFSKHIFCSLLLYINDWMHENQNLEGWRRACGCLKTSEKLKQILQTFPSPPPPSSIDFHTAVLNDGTIEPLNHKTSKSSIKSDYHELSTLASGEHPATCISAECKHTSKHPMESKESHHRNKEVSFEAHTSFVTQEKSRSAYRVVSQLVSLVQLSVTATALALYYLLYCYMQLVYYILRSILYFHNADGPMKVTIAVMVLTSMVVGFNVILRIERMTVFGSFKNY